MANTWRAVIVSQLNAKIQETGVQANLNSKNDNIIFSSVSGQAFDISIRGDLNADGVFDGPGHLNNTVNATVENDTENMNTVDISAPEGAALAIIPVDYATDTINGFRAELGEVQNQFESTIANLASTSENLSAFNSRIRRTGPYPSPSAGWPLGAGPGKRKNTAGVAVVAGLSIDLK